MSYLCTGHEVWIKQLHMHGLTVQYCELVGSRNGDLEHIKKTVGVQTKLIFTVYLQGITVLGPSVLVTVLPSYMSGHLSSM